MQTRKSAFFAVSVVMMLLAFTSIASAPIRFPRLLSTETAFRTTGILRRHRPTVRAELERPRF